MWNHVRILIVDDTTDDRLLNARLTLRELPGATIFEMESGQKALEFLATHSVDLVMTDERMLGMEGSTLVKKIRETDLAVPILVVSLDIRARDRALAAGATQFVNKMDASAIMQSIRSLLASSTIPNPRPDATAAKGETASGAVEPQH